MTPLLELIEKWETYRLMEPSGSVAAFAHWVVGQEANSPLLTIENQAQDVYEPIFSANDPTFDKYPGHQKTSVQGAYLVGRLSQYITFYTKPLMKKHGLHSLDDFGFLQTIRFFKHITKSKACEQMLEEITTGFDIIKRLIKNGFVQEKTDTVDKRQKLLALTDKGENVLDLMFFEFQQIPDTLGNLNETERLTILQWLDSLDRHHAEIVKAVYKK